MANLGALCLDGSIPVLAAGFAGPVKPETLRDVRRAGLDIAELRIDLHNDKRPRAVLSEIAKFKGTPTIATIRSVEDGGKWDGTEEERLTLFKAVIPHVDAIDVELRAKDIRDTVILETKKAGKTAVVSFHDFKWTPTFDALSAFVSEAKAAGADIVKIATLATSDADVRTLARLLVDRGHNDLIVIAMGPHGAKSRVFFPALGSLLTFASLGQSTAPGQMDLQEMMSQLRLFYPAFNEKKIIDLQIMEAI